jgi:hypothetical protein
VQVNSVTSIPCPIGRTLGDVNGNERKSTLTIAVASLVAARSVEDAFQCVYQSTSGVRRGRTSGAASRT